MISRVYWTPPGLQRKVLPQAKPAFGIESQHPITPDKGSSPPANLPLQDGDDHLVQDLLPDSFKPGSHNHVSEDDHLV